MERHLLCLDDLLGNVLLKVGHCLKIIVNFLIDIDKYSSIFCTINGEKYL